MTARFPVMEIFGPTIQGEGRVIGRKTMFVRTAGCDYSCSWCDSAFTWDGTGKEEIEWLSTSDIMERLLLLDAQGCGHVTLSGGNPALLKHLGELVDVLHRHQIEVALETQGSRWQEWFLQIDQLTISPKPPSSGMQTDWGVLDDLIGRLVSSSHPDVSLKVVLFDEADLEYAIQVHQRYPSLPFYVQAGNDDLSEADNGKLLLRQLARYEQWVERIMSTPQLRQVSVLPQLHTWLWGNKRGV
ncbi:7-carboxy-7-deazaguanine synthase QueE [Paenibacillus sp. SYP-B4298]|uniref:7-carboxy-7-deazaguanine synthase QueE n=1 Tax=Paenibacillus sp. SYP-B4298 TaxID=2996034 RepID=UPI0022DE93E0|nr:7-carboxy-7-deazaguanine synthase QueE [Paenibacillus sp. SYP-B4298]